MFLFHLADAPQLTMGETLLMCITGLIIVLVVLFVLQLFITVMSKGIDSVFKKVKPQAAEQPAMAAAGTNIPASGLARREVVLENVSEQDAVVMMAIVADQIGIAPEQLLFKHIKLVG